MEPYIPFTDEQKRRANAVDLEGFLLRRGEKLLPSGRDKRLVSDHSVTIRGSEWFDHETQRGGHAIAFVQMHDGCSFQEAVAKLLNGEQGQAFQPAEERRAGPPKPFALPLPHHNMRRVYAYLMRQRHIDREIITHFARAGTLYEDADYHNAVFVGLDEHGVPRHAQKRSTNSRGRSFKLNVEGSDARYSFHHRGDDGDLYVFEEVCKTLHRWELEDLPMIPVAVNFAGATLRQESIADKMLRLIEKHHVMCEYLEVEVSEAGNDMNQEMLAETSSKIRKGNVRVILDHFGAKDSSFSILSLMEFDSLKIDKSLITDIVGNSRSQIVAKAVIDICRQLGASVQASGVETQDQLNVLKELGCDYAQGTLFNKPITIDTFEVRYLKG